MPTEATSAYAQFLARNADSLLTHAQRSDGRFGASWQGPVDAGIDGALSVRARGRVLRSYRVPVRVGLR